MPVMITVEKAPIQKAFCGRTERIGQQRLEHDRAGIDGHADLGEDVGDQRDAGEDPARAGAEAAFQKLGDRLNAGLVIERHEQARQHDQTPGVQFPVGHRHAGRRALPGQTDDVLGADVRGEDGGADHDPAGVATGEEVIHAVLLVPSRTTRRPIR